MEIGFGNASLWNAYQTTMRLADAMDVRALAARGGGTTGLVVVTDMGKVARTDSIALRRRIAGRVGVPMEHIGIFATQNHSAPGPIHDVAVRDEAFIAAAEQAVGQLQPAQMAGVCVHPQPPINFCRRVRIDGIGTFTCWYGHRDLGGGRVDLSHFVKRSLNNFIRGEPEQVRSHIPKAPDDFNVPDAPVPIDTPLYPQPARDDALQGLFFRDVRGRPIGSLVRFPTHPVTANVKGRDYGSGDYPAYVRRRAEQGFGGIGMFMTGPCGDSCPIVQSKSLQLAERLGPRIADEAIAELASAEWTADATVAVDTPGVTLPLRDSFPASADEGEKELADLTRQFHAGSAAGAGVGELKRLSDRIESLRYFVRNTPARWSGLEQQQHRGATLDQTLFVLRLGASAIVGLPGEPFNAYSARLRRETIGEDLIVGEQCNGSLGYIPTADEFQHGSYESNASLFDPRVEDLLVNGIKSGMKRIGF